MNISSTLRKRLNQTFLIMLLSSPSLAWSAEPLALTYQDSDLAAPLNSRSQWRPSDAVLQQCRAQEAKQYTACIQAEMKKQKLPTVAIRFNELTSAFITSYRKTGPLTVIKTFIPAADHTQEFFIKNTQGKLINVNGGDVQKLLESQPQLILKFKLPKNFLVAQLLTDTIPAVTQSSGAWKTEFSFQIREQCMACRSLGKVTVAYRFNKSGEFKDMEVVSVRLRRVG